MGESLLRRYLEGEHERVWAELLDLEERVREEPIYSDALAVARETMRRVRCNIETLITRLEQVSYQFGYRELPVRPEFAATQPAVLRLPERSIHETLARFESLAGTLPLSLYAWYEQIGEVNFVGRAPAAWKPAGFKPEVYKRFVGSLPKGVSADIYTFYDEHPELLQASGPWLDPLQVISLDDQFGLFEDWRAQQMDDESPSDEEQEGAEGNPGHFAVEIGPDADFKFDTSGLGAYEMVVPNQGADGVVLNEWHHTTFVDYLRTCFQWAGLPGLEMCRNAPEGLASLMEGLLPI